VEGEVYVDPGGEEDDDEANCIADVSEMEGTCPIGYPNDAERDDRASMESSIESVPDELLLKRIFGRTVCDAIPPGVGGTSFSGTGGWVTSESREGRDKFRGRTMGGAIASDGVFGGPGVRGVSFVISDTSELVDSIWSTGGIVLELGKVRESESRLGLDRFMLNTGGRVSGLWVVTTPGVMGEVEGIKSGGLMEMADMP
jgi:hypothetical protein